MFNHKGVSTIIAVILLLMITIALVSTAWLFTSGFLTGKISKLIEVTGMTGNAVVVRNAGTESIAKEEITILVNGNDVEILNPQGIQTKQSAVLKFIPPDFGTELIDATVLIVGPSNTVPYTVSIIPHEFRVTADTIALWHLNEGSGDKAKDSVQGLEVNLNGQWVDGKFGDAYEFVGSGWVATIFPSAIGNGITYVFWFKLPDTSDTTGTFICTEDVSDSSLEDNLVQTNYGDQGCGVLWLDSGFNTYDTNWHMFVFSKSSISLLCKDDSCVNVGDATGNIPNIKRIEFNGGCGCGYSNFGQGIILDEVHIYNKALSQEEIIDSVYG